MVVVLVGGGGIVVPAIVVVVVVVDRYCSTLYLDLSSVGQGGF